MRLVANLCLGLSGQVFGQNFNSTRLWIRAVPGFRSASRSPGSGARRDVRGAPRPKNRRSGWFRRPSHSSPTVTFPMGNQSDPPGTKGCAHKPVGLDREEGGFGRFTARRSMHPVCIARARAASCRTRPRWSVDAVAVSDKSGKGPVYQPRTKIRKPQKPQLFLKLPRR